MAMVIPMVEGLHLIVKMIHILMGEVMEVLLLATGKESLLDPISRNFSLGK